MILTVEQINKMSFEDLKRPKLWSSKIISGKSTERSVEYAREVQRAISNREDELEDNSIARARDQGLPFKKCTKCGKNKPVLDNPHGFKPSSSVCKRCERDRVKVHHSNRPTQGRDRASQNQMKRQALGDDLSASEISLIRKQQDDCCAYCGENLRGIWHVDHVLPVALGGTNHIENRVLACPTCNSNKRTKTVDEFLAYRLRHKLPVRRGGFYRPENHSPRSQLLNHVDVKTQQDRIIARWLKAYVECLFQNRACTCLHKNYFNTGEPSCKQITSINTPSHPIDAISEDRTTANVPVGREIATMSLSGNNDSLISKVNKSEKKSVRQFANELGLQAELLIEQLKAAGVNKATAEDKLTEQDKTALLDYLRKGHGTEAPKNKITLIRKQVKEIKKSDSSGNERNFQVVEVRKKRVLVRKDDAPAVAVETPQTTVKVTGVNTYRNKRLTKWEQRMEPIRKAKDRRNAVNISQEISQLEQLRNHYFAMPVQELDLIWNKGDNELESPDYDLVRAAIRSKKGIKT